MKADRESLLLYAIMDRTLLCGDVLAKQAEESIQGGATFMQLREKELPFEEFVIRARCIKTVTDRYRVPFVINDNVEVALASGADGVHVGQSDRAAKEVRRIIGEEKILGVSAMTVEQAILAEQDGADYLGVGAVFPTPTKEDAHYITLDTLKAICDSVSIPVVAIGGINESNILQLCESGIDGVAVISALFSRPDIRAAAKRLRALAEKLVER